MNKLIFIFLLYIFLIPSCSGDKHDYLKFTHNEIGFSRACSYYILHNPDLMDIPSYKLDSLKVNSFNIIHGEVSNYGWEWEVVEKYKVNTPVYKNKKVEYDCLNNLTGLTGKCKKNVKELSHYKIIKQKKIKYKKFGKNSFNSNKIKIKHNGKQLVRFCANIERVYILGRGWTIEVDHIPQFDVYTYPEWVWWNSSWSYTRNISISNTVKDLTNYQVKINQNFSTEYSEGKINTTCKDIRFTYYNATAGTETLIPHWSESCNFSLNDNMTLWVNVIYLENNTNTTVYMYYGNLAADSVSNGTNTFLQWHGVESSSFYTTNTTTVPDVAYRGKVKVGGTENVIFGLAQENAFATNSIYIQEYISWHCGALAGGSHTSQDSGIPIVNDQYYIVDFYYTSGLVKYYVDGTNIDNVTTNLPTVNLGPFMSISTGTGESNWALSRKYASPEPTYLIGAEETPPIPTLSKIFFYGKDEFNLIDNAGNIVKINNGEYLNDSGVDYLIKLKIKSQSMNIIDSIKLIKNNVFYFGVVMAFLIGIISLMIVFTKSK